MFPPADLGWQKRMNMPRLNFAASVFGFFWLVYRKIYLYAFIAVSFHIALTVILSKASFPESMATIFTAFLLLLLGNSLYVVHASSKIGHIKLVNSNNADGEIRRAGGTNITAPVIMVTIFMLLIIIAISTGQF
jgi:hypothetical protein